MKTPFLCIWRTGGRLTIWLGLYNWRWWGVYWDGGPRVRRYVVTP